MQHREHDEHGRKQQLVGGRVENPAERGSPAESLRQEAVSRVRYSRREKEGEGRDMVASKQGERDRYHQEDPE